MIPALLPTTNAVLDTASQLLLICARPKLSPAMGPVLRALLERGLDWGQLITAARRNFIVVLLRKHLVEHAADLVPQDVLSELERWRMLNAARSLEIVRIQRWLALDILAENQHAFLKGATLSNQYYGDTYSRQYRDIDLLLERPMLTVAAKKLVAAGFEITKPAALGIEQFDACLRYVPVVELRSPTGIMIELHQALAKSGCVFSTSKYLKASVARPVEGIDLRVLPCTELFVYLCFHHSKHRWSSLHWCADLEAFWQHPELNPLQINALARKLGLAATVEESWKLRSELETLALYGALPAERPPSRLLADCMAALTRSFLPVIEPPEQRREPDFPYGWQKTPGYRWRIQCARFHPSAYDYFDWPLPARWHWLYYLVKPLRVMRSGLGRLRKPQGASG